MASAAHQATKADGHLPRLDGLRGVAILSVLFFHFLRGDHPTSLPARALVLSGDFGWMGVDLFFVLSGFLITGILLRTKDEPTYFKYFYARRLLRIFPLYYGVLFAIFVLLPGFVAVRATDAREIYEGQGWFWMYSMNVAEALRGGPHFHSNWLYIEHVWSLCVEEHFYLVWPLVVWLTSTRSLLRISLGIVVAVPLFRTVLVLNRVDPWVISTLTPCRVDSLVIGAIVALLAQSPGRFARLVRSAPWVLATVCGILLSVVVARRKVIDKMHWSMQTIGFSVVAIGCAAVLVLAISPEVGGPTHLFESRILRWFGKYSYAAYLLHHLMLPLFLRWLPFSRLANAVGSEVLAVVIQASVDIGVSMAAAALSWHLFEKHFLKLKSHFEYAPVLSLASQGVGGRA